MKTENHYSFLTIGKTQESTEASEGFKKYVGYGSSRILGYNLPKDKLDEIMGYESSFEPEYIKKEDGEKVANIHFIVETNPDLCGGIDIKQKAMFTLKPKPALSSDGNTVQVIDDYGNHARMNYEDAKAHKPLPGNYKIDQTNYRIACEGEVDLTAFIQKYLNMPNSLDYINGVWTVKKDAATTSKMRFDRIKDFFNGDFSEIQEALDYQPNNQVKLLYGVKTKEDGKQSQVVCTNADLILRNNANANSIAKAAKDLESAKRAGKYANIDYRVQELAEYDVQPTNLESPSVAKGSEDSSMMPWD